MALRLIELFLNEGDADGAEEILAEGSVVETWHETLDGGRLLVKVLLESERAEPVLDALSKRFGHREGFRLVLLPVEAALPRPEQEKDEVPAAEPNEKPRARLSRDELYADVLEAVKLSWVSVVLAGLSAIVAALGLWKDNPAVVIGAMVIAPLLGPNVALSLATTLADTDLVGRALRANAVGVGTSFALALLMGVALPVTPDIPEIAARTRVDLSDILLALASGVAGALSLTTGISTALIGVMVAVALLPPLAAVGMMLGAGYGNEAFGAFLLLLTNVICVNLAGVLTFLAQGVRPAMWWEAAKARRATRWALLIWAALLLLLALVIHFAQRQPGA